MTEIHKKYRLTSLEEPTDEMLHALMEDVAAAARESSARAEAKKKRISALTGLLFTGNKFDILLT